jgi:hypothetical protein
MNKHIVDGVFQSLGTPGVRKLVLELSGEHNNRTVAKDFELSLWQVRVLNQFLPLLCGELLRRENVGKCQGIVLDFNVKQVA